MDLSTGKLAKSINSLNKLHIRGAISAYTAHDTSHHVSSTYSSNVLTRQIHPRTAPTVQWRARESKRRTQRASTCSARRGQRPPSVSLALARCSQPFIGSQSACSLCQHGIAAIPGMPQLLTKAAALLLATPTQSLVSRAVVAMSALACMPVDGGPACVRTAAQNRTAGRFLRALKAAHVSSGDAQAEGEADPEAFNWAALARHVAGYFKAAPGLACVLGPMSAAPKARELVSKGQPLLPLALHIGCVQAIFCAALHTHGRLGDGVLAAHGKGGCLACAARRATCHASLHGLTCGATAADQEGGRDSS